MRIRDWSSDVCSSDLRHGAGPVGRMAIEGKAAALDALAQGRGAAVWQRLIADVETPVSAALKVRDRKSVGYGKSVSGRLELGGHRILNNKNRHTTTDSQNYTCQ